MAVWDEYTKKLKFFTCYGIVFDSIQLTNEESAQIISKILDPFVFYKKYNYEAISRIEKAETIFRLHGQKALLDTSYNCRVVFNAAPVKSAQSTLQKLIAIEGFLKRICLYLRLFDAKSPQHSPVKDSSQFRQDLAGLMIKKGDSTEYYNISPLSTVSKIVLRKQDPGKLFVYNLEGSIIDSVPLKSAKYAALLEQKQDVFLLYRGWLELQWQQLFNEQMRGAEHFLTLDSGYYAPANMVEKDEQFQDWLLQIKAQRDVIEKKISRLIVPEGIYVEKLIRSFYSDLPSEISYLPGLGFSYSTSYVRGRKVYEMTDHRRNVMASINDRKKSIDSNNDGVTDYYNADVITAADYYPFGMWEPGRAFGAGGNYRYGYNGKENDNEEKGEGNQQDYGMRIYDPRIGRFLSVDPLARFYPGNSVYAFAENSPINFIDLDGLEKFSQQQLNSIKSQNEAKLKVIKQNARLRAIALKGGADAALNANSLGLTDFFGGTNNVNKYGTKEEREAYLRGRVGGDIASIFTGTAEIPTGGAIAASTGLETAGVGAAVGGVVSGHGALTGLIASADLGASLRELYNLNVEGTSGGDVSA
jgi:RHS repeat-associated protein